MNAAQRKFSCRFIFASLVGAGLLAFGMGKACGEEIAIAEYDDPLFSAICGPSDDSTRIGCLRWGAVFVRARLPLALYDATVRHETCHLKGMQHTAWELKYNIWNVLRVCATVTQESDDPMCQMFKLGKEICQ